jgi:hypothetical protein
MNFTLPCNSIPFSISLGLKTLKPEHISIVALNGYNQATRYLSRGGEVNGYREFELQFPQSPNTMLLNVFNSKLGNAPSDEDKTFEITNFSVKPLKTYPLWHDKDIHSFVNFAQWFCANCSMLSAGDFRPSIYRSDDGKFSIDFYNKIRDKNSGRFVNTPARIGHSTGIIEVSKADFDKYTVPMRMIILLHEFSHKYMNPKLGREISDEISADINAANIYLSLGYPTIEAHYAFAKVFRGADNAGNRKRLLILDDFIKKFNRGELLNKQAVRVGSALV